MSKKRKTKHEKQLETLQVVLNSKLMDTLAKMPPELWMVLGILALEIPKKMKVYAS